MLQEYNKYSAVYNSYPSTFSSEIQLGLNTLYVSLLAKDKLKAVVRHST